MELLFMVIAPVATDRTRNAWREGAAKGNRRISKNIDASNRRQAPNVSKPRH